MELIDQNREFPAQAAAWLPTSDSLVLANQDAFQLLILTDDQEEQVTQGPSLPTTLTVSPTSGRIAIARLDNQIDLFDPPRAGDPAAGDPAPSLQGHTGTITSLAFSADGRWLASAATDNSVRIWDVETGVLLGGWQLSYWVTDLVFSPEGARLAGVDLQAFSIHIWEIDSLPLDTPAPVDRALGAPPAEQVLTWTQETIPALYQVEFSPDWSQVAWVARGTVQLMQVSTGELGPALQHEDFVNGVAWSPDGELLASAAAAMVEDQFNPATLIWDPQAGELINTLILPEAASGVYFSPDGKLLAILGAEGEVQLWAAPR
jgi:WD40 repeat protein